MRHHRHNLKGQVLTSFYLASNYRFLQKVKTRSVFPPFLSPPDPHFCFEMLTVNKRSRPRNFNQFFCDVDTDLEIAMNYGSLTVVQARHGLTNITEDSHHIRLAEAAVQPRVHLLDHLTCNWRSPSTQFQTSNSLESTSSLFGNIKQWSCCEWLLSKFSHRTNWLVWVCTSPFLLPRQKCVSSKTSETPLALVVMLESTYFTMFLWPDSELWKEETSFARW